MSNDTDNVGNNNIEMDILSDVSISGKLNILSDASISGNLKVAANQIQFESNGIIITGGCSCSCSSSCSSTCIGAFNLSSTPVVSRSANGDIPIFNKSIETPNFLSDKIVGNYFVRSGSGCGILFYPIVDSKFIKVPKSCTAFYVLNWGSSTDQYIIPNITSWMHNPKGTTEFCKIELDMSFSHDCSTLIAYKKDTSSGLSSGCGSSSVEEFDDTFLFVYSMISYKPGNF